MPLGHPLMSLTLRKTWKQLDEAWLFEQRGDDIVPYDYTHLYQEKQERRRGKLECSFSRLRLVV